MKISFISSRDRLGILILFRYSLDSFSQAEVTAFDLKAMNQAHENQNSDLDQTQKQCVSEIPFRRNSFEVGNPLN